MDRYVRPAAPGSGAGPDLVGPSARCRGTPRSGCRRHVRGVRQHGNVAPADDLQALLAGDADVVADVYRERVFQRGSGVNAWGWSQAYKK